MMVYNVGMNSTNESCSGPPTVTFFGATQSVSGSMHLIKSGRHRFLLDCGLHRGPRHTANDRNAHFAFDPSTIDSLFLSHAHVDHCGNIPNLVRQGFEGPIYCTHATRDLIQVMLEDSARIQEDESNNHRGSFRRGGRSMPPALFGRKDVDKAINQCIAVDYLATIDVNPDVQLRFIDAGHILGSAMIAVAFMQGGREYSVTFTGDLGRRGIPFLDEPSCVPSADLIICESTYGGRKHDTLAGMAAKMADIVTRTVARGGKVLIPAFSLGRTQLVLNYLRVWMADGLLPRLPIYVDSPLAREIDDVYQQYSDLLEPAVVGQACEWLESDDDASFRSTQREPCIIVASGGMCEGGRIVKHLKYHIDDPRSTIILVSYQAPDSVGAQLNSPTPIIRLHGQIWNKWIEVAEINGFSGHADEDDFEFLLRGAVESTGRVRLVHGELPQMHALAKQFKQMGFADVGAPKRNEMVSL